MFSTRRARRGRRLTRCTRETDLGLAGITNRRSALQISNLFLLLGDAYLLLVKVCLLLGDACPLLGYPTSSGQEGENNGLRPKVIKQCRMSFAELTALRGSDKEFRR
jgi:hypothetical protein